MTDKIKEALNSMDLSTATSILKFEKKENDVVDLGCNYCDNFIEALRGVKKLMKDTPTKNDISDLLENADKIIADVEAKKKWTAKQWIDWAKAVKDKK